MSDDRVFELYWPEDTPEWEVITEKGYSSETLQRLEDDQGKENPAYRILDELIDSKINAEVYGLEELERSTALEEPQLAVPTSIGHVYHSGTEDILAAIESVDVNMELDLPDSDKTRA